MVINYARYDGAVEWNGVGNGGCPHNGWRKEEAQREKVSVQVVLVYEIRQRIVLRKKKKTRKKKKKKKKERM